MSDLPTHREATFFLHPNYLPQKAGRSLLRVVVVLAACVAVAATAFAI
jgi:hypothetical protein